VQHDKAKCLHCEAEHSKLRQQNSSEKRQPMKFADR